MGGAPIELVALAGALGARALRRASGSSACATSAWRSTDATCSRPACPRDRRSGVGLRAALAAKLDGGRQGASRSSPRPCAPPASAGSLRSMEAAPAMTLPEPFYELGEHVGDRPVRRTRAVHDPPWRLLRGPYESLNLGRLTDDVPTPCGTTGPGCRSSARGQAGSRPAGPRNGLASGHGPGRRVRRAAARDRTSSCPTPTARPRACAGWRRWCSPPTACRSRGSEPGATAAPPSRCCTPAGGGLRGGIVAEGSGDPRARRRRRARAQRSVPARAAAATRSARRCTRCSPATATASGRGATSTSRRSRAHQLSEPALQTVARRRAVHDLLGSEALFFSHRRDRGITGRQAGLAWLS